MCKISLRNKKGQLLLIGIVILVIIGLAYGFFLSSFNSELNLPVQGTPTKNQQTGLYHVNLLVMGHRDWTIFHFNLHSNIRIDSITYYFQEYPTPPSGRTLIGFSKMVHVTVTVKDSSLNNTLVSTFDNLVSVGAEWGRLLTYDLPSGSYLITVESIDKDGFSNYKMLNLTLP
jgi:hypothetical protein